MALLCHGSHRPLCVFGAARLLQTSRFLCLWDFLLYFCLTPRSIALLLSCRGLGSGGTLSPILRMAAKCGASLANTSPCSSSIDPSVSFSSSVGKIVMLSSSSTCSSSSPCSLDDEDAAQGPSTGTGPGSGRLLSGSGPGSGPSTGTGPEQRRIPPGQSSSGRTEFFWQGHRS